jgi:hypothetical protein
MTVSPAAMLCLVTGTAQLVRRVELSPRLLRHEARVGCAAVVSMAAFLGGALCWVTKGWVTERGPGPLGLIHVGAIDAAGLAVMVIALATGWQALQRARSARPSVAVRR